MPLLLNCQKISKFYRSRPLFRNLSLSIDDGERVGVVGPNGCGKSTLMKIMSGLTEPDEGELTARKGLRVCYLPQEDKFVEPEVGQVLANALSAFRLAEHEEETQVEKQLTQFGFEGRDQPVVSLSGGWRKRLALARELIKEPDLLLLDEPTNHLDLSGIIWLEKLLMDAGFSFILVSHDRNFLENVTTRMIELNPAYADGYLSVNGTYSDFLIARQEYLASQANLEQALASKVRREVAWLQRGARARQTKSQARIRDAGELMDSLAEVRFRNTQNARIGIDFDASGRKTRQLLVAKGLEKSLGGRLLLSNLDITLSPGTRLGLLGANGSGKTTLLRILAEQLPQDRGTIKRADNLRIVWFDQNREQLDKSQTLWKALCAEGDSVVYRGRSTHVSTWAKRFLFKPDQLHLPVSHLSGGEQSRILIANLMLKPADVLILDEPTNDLDIPSLEVLEDSLIDFPGAVVLVTHDRFMLHEVSNSILALDGSTRGKYFADYAQWEASVASAQNKPAKQQTSKTETPVEKTRSLSTSEKKELTEMESQIDTAEKVVLLLKRQLENPKIASDHARLIELQRQVDEAQQTVTRLYQRWQDLELRQR